MSLITGDYGSVWQESIIRTPIGVYGVDTFAKKIWRYSESKGFETISDMVIQRFLNDHIILKERTSVPDLGLRNVKTHYNNYKGDVMFTFYNYDKNEKWNLCYNERIGKWTTRYSWTPIYSENINNIYYSFDQKRVEVLSQIGNILGDDYGFKCEEGDMYYTIGNTDAAGNTMLNSVSRTFKLTGNLIGTRFTTEVTSIETSYLDINGSEVFLQIPVDSGVITCNEPDDTWQSTIITLNPYLLSQCYLDSLPTKEIPVEDGVNIIVDTQYQTTSCPLWVKANIKVNCFYGDVDEIVNSGIDRNYTICFMVNPNEGVLTDTTSNEKKMYDKMFINGVHVHGRAGIFDEIDYTDDELDNQILPTKWYDKQEPFEFEFVVNDPIGLHKVFENLMIVSNNVAPEEIQYEIEGDAYSVWKTMNGVYDKNKKREQYQNNTLFKNASVKWDTILNQYSILMSQDCKSIERFGRRLGNMHYKEDAWYITINPLLLNKNGKTVSTKLRDKYLKVRVRYSGTDLAVITAIKTSMNLSHS